jgi:hypothetical protein
MSSPWSRSSSVSKADKAGHMLWIGNIPDCAATETNIRDLCSPFGLVLKATVRHKPSKENGSWALVTFAQPLATQRAKEAGLTARDAGGIDIEMRVNFAKLDDPAEWQWMWGDVNRLANYDPSRWSWKATLTKTIAELQSVTEKRPVRLCRKGAHQKMLSSPRAAVEWLETQGGALWQVKQQHDEGLCHVHDTDDVEVRQEAATVAREYAKELQGHRIESRGQLWARFVKLLPKSTKVRSVLLHDESYAEFWAKEQEFARERTLARENPVQLEDNQVTHCMACNESEFWKWPARRELRRHHCHRCGWVVCLACRTDDKGADLMLDLAQEPVPEGRAGVGKVCKLCFQAAHEKMAKAAAAQTALAEAAKAREDWERRWQLAAKMCDLVGTGVQLADDLGINAMLLGEFGPAAQTAFKVIVKALPMAADVCRIGAIPKIPGEIFEQAKPILIEMIKPHAKQALDQFTQPSSSAWTFAAKRQPDFWPELERQLHSITVADLGELRKDPQRFAQTCLLQMLRPHLYEILEPHAKQLLKQLGQDQIQGWQHIRNKLDSCTVEECKTAYANPKVYAQQLVTG